MNNKIKAGLFLAAPLALMMAAGCQKTDRPSLGDYPKDTNPPGGPLKFYTAFDGTTSDPLMNAVDSVRANFPQVNPLSSVAGITGKAVQCKDGTSVYYPSANDFRNSTSFTIAFWIKNAPAAGRTEFLFSLVDPTYSGWSYSAAFVLVENQTTTKTTMKFGLMDQWLEGDFNKPVFDGTWHHIVYVYDQVTSKMTYYFDGQVVTGLTATQTDVKKSGAPRGPVDFTKSNKMIIGGWNKHGNASGPKDDWIRSFSGNIDQFRMYGKALSASEVSALYSSKL
jgi:Concanavalin A-like lectin/glucanases superfamily